MNVAQTSSLQKEEGVVGIWLITRDLPPNFSGAGKNDMLIAPLLGQRGLKPCFIGQSKSRSRECNIFQGIKIIGLGRLDDWKGKLLWVYQFIKELRSSKPSPSLIRFRGYNISYAAIISIIRVMRLPVKIVSQPACMSVDNPAAISGRRLGKWQLKQILRSDAVFAMNPVIAEEFLSMGYPKSKIYPVRNPVDTKKFIALNSEEKNSLRKSLGLQEGVIVITVGIIDSRKRQSFITEAFALAAMDRSDVYLLHIGPDTNDLKTLGRLDKIDTAQHEMMKINDVVKNYGIEKYVSCIGHRKDVEQYMSAADIFVHASVSEGEANVVNEALSSGMATVLPLDPVYSAQVPNDCAAWFEKDGGIITLSSILKDLFERKELIESLSERGRDHILATRRLDIAANYYAESLCRVIKCDNAYQ